MPFIKLTHESDGNDVWIDADRVTAATRGVWLPDHPPTTAVFLCDGSVFYVKEHPAQVTLEVSAATDDDCAGCQFDPDAVFELTPFAEELLKTQASKMTPVPRPNHELRELLNEAQSDAKVADERAEWFKKLAEQRLAEFEQLKGDHKTVSAWYSELVDRHADKMAEMRKLEARANSLDTSLTVCDMALGERDVRIAEYQRTAKVQEEAIQRLSAELAEWRNGNRNPWTMCSSSKVAEGYRTAKPQTPGE